MTDTLARLTALRDELTHVNQHRTRLLQQRAQLITQARREGHTLTRIATLTGITYQRVGQITDRHLLEETTNS